VDIEAAAGDARLALAQGDTRFLLYSGPWYWRMPGVDSACARQLPASRLRLVRFIGDVVRSAADESAAATAQADTAALDAYVWRYNATVAAGTDRCEREQPPSPRMQPTNTVRPELR
jgi:hypothetical protein